MKSLQDILPADTQTTTRTFKKGDVIQRAGDNQAASYYVTKGLLRGYTIDSNGKEHIFMFAPENWIIADLEAIEYNEPVQLFIDCLEDTEVVIFEKDHFFKSEVSKEQVLEVIKLLTRRIGRLQRRVLMLMSAPAIDRYTYFTKTYPNLLHRVPQRMIATYLGIAPQTLSTLRSNSVQSS